MKRKLISQTYLRDVNKYEMHSYFDKDDYYLTVKKLIDVQEPFVLSDGLCLMDNNYYVVEVVPKNENYTMRVFLNEKKERLYYYFDITLGNGIDEKTKIPYYNDLYLDVTLENGKMRLLDEDELQEALDNNDITQEAFDLAYKTKDVLVDSIKNKNNRYMNLNIESYL